MKEAFVEIKMTISECRNCPFCMPSFSPYDSECTKKNKPIDNVNSIPDWCPYLIEDNDGR